MKTSQKLISAIFALALMAAPAAGQQPAKSGKYMGKLAGHLPGSVEQTYELEKDHVFVLGPFHGVFLNDVADGFLDKTEVVCPRALDIVGGKIVSGHGYCIMTDKDGDKAFLVWEVNDPTGKGGGNFKWTGGTGKYTGLQGNNAFHGAGIGKTGAGLIVWEGDWRLP